MKFPVDEVIQSLRAALAQRHRAVLIAPPGAGKTTRVPPALLDNPGRIVMLEPRRIAARAAARWMARQLGEDVGGTVGYRVRGETRVGRNTRIEVITEGVLIRMLHEDPGLQDYGTVIFDEFHERSLIADTSLALLLGATAVLRDDINILVMSATLDGAAVARLLDDAPVIESSGRIWPVETRLAPRSPDVRLEEHVARVTLDALGSEPGSALVFLPGAGEIRRVEALLVGRLPDNTDLFPLHGSLSPEMQDAAIAPASGGRRKVVLATNVAETSLTIDGVRIVIDSGYERVPRFSPRNGMTRLETARITRSSADQRRGRAGRTEPGIAIRCWSAIEDAALSAAPRAEILDADMAPLVLNFAALGFRDPPGLPWLDSPPGPALAAGRELLRQLGAIDTEGEITEHGRAILAEWGEPRLAHLAVLTRQHDAASYPRAVALAALLEERDLFRGNDGPPPVDVELRLEIIERDRGHRSGDWAIDHGVLARVRERMAQHGVRAEARAASLSAGRILAWGWPERIARRRGQAGRFLLANGRGVRLDERDPLAHKEWLVVPALDDSGRDGRVQLAVSLDDEEIAAIIAEQATTTDEVEWDDEIAGVVARRRQQLGAIVLADHPLRDIDEELVQRALLDGIRRRGVGLLPWKDAAVSLRQRLAFLHHHDQEWPSMSDEALIERADEWLAPLLAGVRKLDQLSRVDLGAALLGLLTWEQRSSLDRLAPIRIEVPSGSKIALDYSEPSSPVLAVRLQEVFGMMDTPRLMDGKVPVTMHLLSPARRPVQVTRDLASFWKNGYPEVRKELKGRYPKHRWPE
jgi:ATP-dependent helicase HrpB